MTPSQYARVISLSQIVDNFPQMLVTFAEHVGKQFKMLVTFLVLKILIIVEFLTKFKLGNNLKFDQVNLNTRWNQKETS